ncbi:MAG: serine hydrolase domain-containing protein [Bacteroidota bacterium]
MQKVLLILLSCLLLTAQLFSQSIKGIDAAAITELLSQYVEGVSPGLAVGIVQDGQIVYEQYLGYANLEHQIKIDEHTRSNIASTAKQFTALMILELSLEGKLSLEDDFRKYVPSLYPTVKQAIKIRHLINHTSGIRDYVFILEMMNRPYWKQIGMDNDDVMELLAKQEELTFEPGTAYSYSNSGYNILAEVIEAVSGQSFNDYSKAFFEKLGMEETEFIRRYMGVIPNRADSYSDWGDGLWLSTPTLTKFNGEGFLFTTLRDQLRYEQAVQQAQPDQNELLIKSQQAIPNSEIQSYGFGLELDGRLGREAQYHSGSTFGYHSHTSRFPEQKLSIFVMSNNGRIWSGDVADEVAAAVLPEIEEQPAAYADRFYQEERGRDQVQILGQYLSASESLVRIVQEEGRTYWRRGSRSPIELLPEGNNTYHLSYEPRTKLVFYEAEMLLYFPSGETDVYTRSKVLPASFTDLEAMVGEYYSRELEMGFELTLREKDKLVLTFSNRDRDQEVKALNRNELLASGFVLKVQRDRFDRAIDFLVTLNNRAKNNRFTKKTNLTFQPKIETKDGSIQVTTIGSSHGDASNILLTKNYPNGNEMWFKQFGGNSYDKASSIVATEDGYLIVGSTSSYGNGNYDMFVIKTDKEGRKQWQNTYGEFYNEYGYTAEKTEEGYLIKGTIQHCTSNSDVLNRECTTHVWFVAIDKYGKEMSRQVLEEI